ncbi:hypothetical protein [Nitrosopumilus sp.]|uniref:hypothetical protein n=1 Tax=Nitrosopumilus sp. TaxID=2024843 RepID=UPI002931CA90|nr:hypothetical protein [Nitrosopumilus sp.]
MKYKAITLFFLLFVVMIFGNIPSSYSSDTQEFQDAKITVSSKTVSNYDEKDKQFFDAYNKIIQLVNGTLSEEESTESSSKQMNIHDDEKIPIIFTYVNDWGPILIIGIDDIPANVNNYRDQIAEIIDNRNITIELVSGQYNIESCKASADSCYLTESMYDVDIKYKAPLRQIRDDGVYPENVRCNEGKVLFFKISSKMPVCIYEKSIERFNNDFIGWFGVHNDSFLTHYDLEYLNEKQTLLDRNTTVTYSVDHNQNSIVYSTQESITNIDNHSVIYDPAYEDGLYEIVNENGNDVSIDWDDPRTSIGSISSVREDVARMHNLKCESEQIHRLPFLSNESSFKILKNTTTILLDYDDRVLQDNYEQINDNEFTHTFWSQGKTNFVFADNLEEMNITERVCKTTHLPKVYLYEVTFRMMS